MFEDDIGSEPPGFDYVEPYLYEVGDTIDGRYLVRAKLGNGGMGAVLRVEDKTNKQSLALKYCKPGQNQKRFAREVRIMESIDSPHVIPIVGANLDHEPPYFLMPLGERSLEADIPHLCDDESTALTVFRQVCLGVRDLHSRNVFHRDLKPSNVLRLADDKVVVCDLGLARFENRDTTILTRTIHRLGTEDYLAPEQRETDGSRNADARTDVYQLGKTLYQLITGNRPRMIKLEKLPPGLGHIVRRATSEHPVDRYQSVDKLDAAIEAYQSSKDARKNPREVLEHLVTRLEAQVAKEPPSDAELAEVLETLSHGAWLDHAGVIECVHRVPQAWLPKMARDHEPRLYPVMQAYAAAVQDSIGGYEWAFADQVAVRMRAIYDNGVDTRTRVLALCALMCAADRLGRHAPQKAFCAYLEEIRAVLP